MLSNLQAIVFKYKHTTLILFHSNETNVSP
jgi:hypothetical protein